MYVKRKALEIAQILNIQEFTASNGWYEKFIKRYQINSIQLYGEGGSLDKSDPALLQKLDEFYAEVFQYRLDHIYNMDKMGCFTECYLGIQFRLITKINTLYAVKKLQKKGYLLVYVRTLPIPIKSYSS